MSRFKCFLKAFFDGLAHWILLFIVNQIQNMKLEEFVEKVFFPSNVSIIAGIILLIYTINSPFILNNFIVFVVSMLVYKFSVSFTKRKVESETKKFSIAAFTSLILFLMLAYFLPLSKVFLFGVFTLFLLNIIHHSVRDLWKISTHTMTYTAICIFFAIIDFRFSFGFILLPLVVWSRLKLKRHTVLQVVIGFIVGLIVPLLIRYFISI